MEAWRADRTKRRQHLERLRDRREAAGAREPFDVWSPGGSTEYLCVRDRLLTTAAAVADPAFLNLLGQLGLQPEPAPPGQDCLQGRVALLGWIQSGSHAGIEHALRRLSRTTHRVTRTYLTPQGPVMKSHQTPEPTELPWPVRPPTGTPGTVPIAVIDTGVAFQARTDRWLQDLLANGSEPDPLDQLPTPDGFLDAGAGHGSFVSGVVQQIAPDAPLKVYQALDSDGLASELEVACTIVRAVEQMLQAGGRLVVNLSLGTETVDDEPPIALEAALDVVHDLEGQRNAEVLVVAAAGNEGRNRPCWPAASERVVAVAGLMPDLTPAPFSSRGPWVNCSTVAAGVRSPYVSGRESTEFDDDPETWPADTWAQWTGTSFAAPQVSAAVALLAERVGTSLADALQTLLHDRPRLPLYGRSVEILS